ncbi:MAG: GntR family transcriptional regulator [Candidatus Krumholzibacteriia bacterium]
MFERRPLRTHIRDEILARLVSGDLAAGDRINESRLSVELAVSRTPLREALICLVEQGLLLTSPGRGFLVPDLDSGAFRETGEVLAILEPALVREIVPPSPDLLMELGNHLSRARLGDGGSPARLAVLLFRFSESLALRCPVRRLADLVVQQVEFTLRYLRAARTNGWDPTASLDDLQVLVDELRRAEPGPAAAAAAEWRRQLTRRVIEHLPGPD